MALRVVEQNNVGAINLDKLDEDIRAAVPDFVGLSQGRDHSVLQLLFQERVSDADIQIAQGLYYAHDPNALASGQQLLMNIQTVAQGAVGTALTDLTTSQQKALMAILLWQAGGVAQDGTVKPLGQWVR